MVAAGIESINHAQPAADEAQLDDAFSYNLGANYNAGWAKFFLYGQIFENYANAAKTTTFHQDSGVDGFGVNIGADVPLFGGTFKASFGYGDFEASRDSALSMKTCQTAVGYTYSLSRRTTLYTAAGWIHSNNSSAYEAQKPAAAEDIYQFTAGIVHKF